MRSILCKSLGAMAVMAIFGFVDGQAFAADETHVAGSSAATGATDSGASRMRLHQGIWWYQHPDNTWSYYQHNQWLKYTPRAFSVPATSSAANANAAGGATRYQSGYRGVTPAPANDK